jgi:hypothetical protein
MTFTACGGRVLETYEFSDGQVLTKRQKGGEIVYQSAEGTVGTVNGDIVVVQKGNQPNDFQDHRARVQYFSAVYNVNLPDPVIGFDEYYVTPYIYPGCQVVTAVRGGDNPNHSYWTIRMFDGKKFIRPVMERPMEITGYVDVFTPDEVRVDEASGKITLWDNVVQTHFYLKDIKPEQIRGNEIVIERTGSTLETTGEYDARVKGL